MTGAPTAYPLAWPKGRERTPVWDRREGRFSTGADRYRKPVTMSQALRRLEEEAGRFGAMYPMISTDVELRRDGLPYSGRRAPDDPGAVLYFQKDGAPYALACDTFSRVEQNVAAIAAHIDATRAIERHGVATASDMLRAFQALPPPPPGGSVIIGETVRHWSDVLDVSRTASRAVIEAAYRAKAKEVGNDSDGLLPLNLAKEAALKDADRNAQK